MIQEFCNRIDALDEAIPMPQSRWSDFTPDEKFDYDTKLVLQAMKWAMSTLRLNQEVETALFAMKPEQLRAAAQNMVREGVTSMDGVKYWLNKQGVILKAMKNS